MGMDGSDMDWRGVDSGEWSRTGMEMAMVSLGVGLEHLHSRQRLGRGSVPDHTEITA
jgi:hypothetical protein